MDYYEQRLADLDAEIAARQAEIDGANEAFAGIVAELDGLSVTADSPKGMTDPAAIMAAARARAALAGAEGAALRRAQHDLEKRRESLYSMLGTVERRRQAIAAERDLPGTTVERLALVLGDLEALASGSNGSKYDDNLLKLCYSIRDGLRGPEQLLKGW